MLIVIDDVLDSDNLAIVHKFFHASPQARQMRWVDGNLEWFLKSDGPFSKILNKVSNVFDISSMIGMEQWAHYGTKPNWHIDKDESFFAHTGQISTPICSIVFYAEIYNLTNGKFMTDDIAVIPKTNRLLVFSPGVRHGVEDYTGTRFSVAINPWSTKPKDY